MRKCERLEESPVDWVKNSLDKGACRIDPERKMRLNRQGHIQGAKYPWPVDIENETVVQTTGRTLPMVSKPT